MFCKSCSKRPPIRLSDEITDFCSLNCADTYFFSHKADYTRAEYTKLKTVVGHLRYVQWFMAMTPEQRAHHNNRTLKNMQSVITI